MKPIVLSILFSLSLIFIHPVNAQEYSYEDFVGTWNGTISSELYGGYNYNTTIVIGPNDSYSESTGTLMPTIYPNSQWFEYSAATNRLGFHWLQTVYSGQYFYQYNYLEIVYFDGSTLELHYNYWDDPEPWPEAQTIIVVKEGTVTGIEDEFHASNNKRNLIRVLDMMGREVSKDTKGQVLIYQYDDGSVEKKSVGVQ
jgi:hypothetical protein